MIMTTFMQKHKEVTRKWYVIDANDMPLGRVASKAAHVLRGKLNDKMYYNHSGYTGGLRVRSAKVMRENYPEEMIERAVKGMLPKGRLGRQMYKKLFVYAGEDHKHSAQKPVEMKLN